LWFIRNVTNINLSKTNIMATPSLLLIPDRYKAAKLYSQIPDSGAGDLTFARASVATRVNASGLIESVASGVPRLDYPVSGGCPSLLLEPQRTNACPFSEQLDNAAWFKFEGTITPNVISAPDGTISADLFLDTAVSQEHVVEQGVSTGVGVHTWSVFAKAQNLNFLIINAFSGSSNRTWFNLSNGTIGTNAAGSTATITNYGNGWYRCSVTRNYTSGSFLFVAQTAPSDGVFSYTGSVNGIYLWGAQVELGSYPTSYIPTLGSSVTRLADAASKTGISSLIGQSEGVIFIDFIASAQNADGETFSTITIFGDANDNFQIYTIGTTLYWYAFKTPTVLIDQTASETLVAGNRYKIAFAYKANDYALYINGVQKRTSTAANVPAVSQFNFSATGFGTSAAKVKNEYNTAAMYTTRLTNSELATLTAL
jgi:hypothetical protein